MCTKLKVGTSMITPGTIAQYRILSGIRQGKFGVNFGRGDVFNAREDNLDGFWRKMDAARGILEIDTFYEHAAAFGIPGQLLKVGCLYMPSGNFVVVTTDANLVVAPFHHRMPLIISDEELWWVGNITHGGHELKRIAA